MWIKNRRITAFKAQNTNLQYDQEAHTQPHTHSANTESTRTTESFSSQSIDKNVSHSTDENAPSSQSSQDAMIAYNSTGEFVLPAHEELHSLVVNVQQEGSVPAVPIGENEKEKVYLNDKKTPKQEKNDNAKASHEQKKKKKEKESVSVRKNKTRKEKVYFNEMTLCTRLDQKYW